MKGFEAVPCIFQTLIDFRVCLPENSILNRGLGNLFAHNSEVLAFKLLGAALTPDSNYPFDADVQEMLQELVQCVICVATN